MASLEGLIKNIADLFEKYDTDSDGKLSVAEIEELVENEVKDETIKAKIKKHGVAKIIGKQGKGPDGTVELEEFSRVICVLMKRFYFNKKGKGKGGEDSTEDAE